MIYEEMIGREYLKFIQNMEAIQREIDALPKGSIVIHRIHGREYHYLDYYEERKKRSRRLNKEEIETVQRKIDKRRALKRQLDLYKKEQSKFLKVLKVAQLNPELIQQIYESARQERREAQKRYQAELIKAQGKRYSEQYRIPTIRGDLVASKSEMMIANALARRDIKYWYEKELCIGDCTLSPDFTILYDEKTYYWEHCGLMDKAEYVASWDFKKTIYNRVGIFEGDTLITTYETKNNPLTEQRVERMITIYFNDGTDGFR